MAHIFQHRFLGWHCLVPLFQTKAFDFNVVFQDYPLHLGVTEAGGGADGARLKHPPALERDLPITLTTSFKQKGVKCHPKAGHTHTQNLSYFHRF